MDNVYMTYLVPSSKLELFGQRRCRLYHVSSCYITWKMFSQAPIVAAARGTGLLNMVSSFTASVLISVMLFWKIVEFQHVHHLIKNQAYQQKEPLSSLYQKSKGKREGKRTCKHHDKSKLQCQLQKICRRIWESSHKAIHIVETHGCSCTISSINITKLVSSRS